MERRTKTAKPSLVLHYPGCNCVSSSIICCSRPSTSSCRYAGTSHAQLAQATTTAAYMGCTGDAFRPHSVYQSPPECSAVCINAPFASAVRWLAPGSALQVRPSAARRCAVPCSPCVGEFSASGREPCGALPSLACAVSCMVPMWRIAPLSRISWRRKSATSCSRSSHISRSVGCRATTSGLRCPKTPCRSCVTYSRTAAGVSRATCAVHQVQ